MSHPTNVVSLEIHDNVAVIAIDSPPVNAITAAVRSGLHDAVQQAAQRADCLAILILTSGRVFMAGVDLSEFEGAFEGPALQDVMALIEGLGKPVVVAMQGAALGGGLELAMACHYRLASPGATLGLPEITLGLIPGAGGTQRLPRLVGARRALDMILSGKAISASEGRLLGLIDEIVEDDLRSGAIEFCRRLVREGERPAPTRALSIDCAGFDEAGKAEALAANARALRGRTTQDLVLKAISGAIDLDFDAGLALEAELAAQSLTDRESIALRRLFFAERAVGKPSGQTPEAPSPIRHVAIVGAGTMGSGIAVAFANVGVSVTLIDEVEEGLARGRAIIERSYSDSVRRGRLSEDAAKERLALISYSLDLSTVALADVVIEAVFEDLAVKTALITQIDGLLPSGRLIATNTSTLSVTELAGATGFPGRVVGLHFFSPAHIMKLLEIVRGDDTTPEALATAVRVARLLKKVGVVTGDRFGFIGNRMMLDGYFREAEQLLLEGATPLHVDQAIEAFGFAMGPHRVSDLGGTDVGTKARAQLFVRETRPDPYFVIADSLTGMGHLGQKSGLGFYRYERGEREAHEEPLVLDLIERLATKRGITRREISAEEIVERCILVLINVGAKVLEEGVAASAADIDVVWTSGYGFPRALGGPMFYADTLGLRHVADRISHYHRALGHYWEPTPLLLDLARAGSSFEAYDMARQCR